VLAGTERPVCSASLQYFAGAIVGALITGDSLKYGLAFGTVASVILCGLAFAIAPFISHAARS
jgi:hypothetical protein